MQLAIDNSLIEVYSAPGSSIHIDVVQAKEFPEPKLALWEKYRSTHGFLTVMGPIFIIIALFPSNFRYCNTAQYQHTVRFSSQLAQRYLPTLRFLADSVTEKEQRIKELMRMMGLKPAVEEFTWFTTMLGTPN